MRRLYAAAALALVLLCGPTSASAANGALTLSGVERAAAVPTGAAITLDVDGAVPGAAPLQSIDIALPAGMSWNVAAGVASGRTQCPADAFALGAATASRCPASSAVGTVSVTVPGEPAPRTGTLAIGTPGAGGTLPTLLIEASANGSAEPAAPRIKAIAGLRRGGDGRLTVSIDQVPAPALSQLRLELAGGPASLLTTPASCGVTAATATLLDAGDGSRSDLAAPLTIDQGCQPPPAAGGVAMGQGTGLAGGRGAVGLAAARLPGAPAMRSLHAQLPSGLLGDLTNAADCTTFPNCSVASQIGSVTLWAGTGEVPLQLTGALFLTTRPPGMVAGLGAVLRVASGTADLGFVSATGAAALRPTDAGLDIALTLPTTASGHPLQLQRAAITVDRPGFMLHPSRCGAQPWVAAMVTDDGVLTPGSGVFTYAGCELPTFTPTLEASLTGDRGPKGHPAVRIALTAPPADAHLATAEVRLPSNLAADVANLQHPCELAAFNAVDCSADSRVGTAVVRVSLTAEPIPGDVYLVRLPGRTLPGLGMSFTGRFAQRVLATAAYDRDDRLVVTYPAIPDLPIQRLDMTITGGAGGPLVTVDRTCPKGMVWDASFVAQGGQRSSHTIPAPCPPADAARARIRLSTTRGLRVRVKELGGRHLHSAKITLPRRYRFVTSRAGNRRFRSLRLGVGTGRVIARSRTVRVYPKTESANQLDLTLREGTVTGPAAPAGRRARSVVVEVRLAFTDGSVQRQRIRVRPT